MNLWKKDGIETLIVRRQSFNTLNHIEIYKIILININGQLRAGVNRLPIIHLRPVSDEYGYS